MAFLDDEADRFYTVRGGGLLSIVAVGSLAPQRTWCSSWGRLGFAVAGQRASVVRTVGLREAG